MTTTPSDLTRLAFVRLNSTYAVPGSPTMKVARFASEGLVYTPNVVESPELDESGQLADSLLVGSTAAGPVEFPLARSTWFDEMLAAVFRNDWATGTLAEDIVTPGTFVSRAVGANELIPAKSLFLYDVEKKFEVPTVGPLYHQYRRMGVNSLALRLQPNEIIMGSIAMVGSDMIADALAITGATYPDPGEYRPFTAPKVTEITIGGLSAAQCFSNLSINFNSNLRGIPCIGLEADKTKGLGRFIPTIEGTTYFLSNEHIDALIAQSFLAVTVELTDGTGNKYKFYFPKMKFTSAPVTTPGSNQDVMQPIALRGHYSINHKYSCLITRTQAA